MITYQPVSVTNLKIGDTFLLNPNAHHPAHTVNFVMARDGHLWIFADDNDPLTYFLFSPNRQVYFAVEDGSRDITVNLTDEQLRLIASWKSGESTNRRASDEECKQFITGAINDLLRLVADFWPIHSTDEES